MLLIQDSPSILCGPITCCPVQGRGATTAVPGRWWGRARSPSRLSLSREDPTSPTRVSDGNSWGMGDALTHTPLPFQKTHVAPTWVLDGAEPRRPAGSILVWGSYRIAAHPPGSLEGLGAASAEDRRLSGAAPHPLTPEVSVWAVTRSGRPESSSPAPEEMGMTYLSLKNELGIALNIHSHRSEYFLCGF